MEDEAFGSNLGISRRTLIKRGAVVGGTLVWAAPMVQTLATPALAQGSPACRPTVVVFSDQDDDGTVETCTRTTYNNQSPECCECLEERKGQGDDAFEAATFCNAGPNAPCTFEGNGTDQPC